MANPAVLYAQEQSVQHLKSKKNVTSLSDGSFHFETEDSLRKKKPRVAVGTTCFLDRVSSGLIVYYIRRQCVC